MGRTPHQPREHCVGRTFVRGNGHQGSLGWRDGWKASGAPLAAVLGIEDRLEICPEQVVAQTRGIQWLNAAAHQHK